MSLKVGKSYYLDNKQYDILSELPSGTFKSTYIALDKHNDTKVVIAESKVSGNVLLEGKKFKRIIKYLKGPNDEIECNPRIICPIAIIENGKYIITNYFEGTDLFEYIGNYIVEKRFIPLDEVHKIMSNCVEAMIDLHDKLHFVHLDIKPENIMFNEKTSDIGIIDLGEGCSLDDIFDCDFGPSKGTDGYMSPEIIFKINEVKYSKDLMRSSDVYSMGCVFYELLYLRRPFDWMQQSETSIRDGIKNYIKSGKKFETMYDINKNRDRNLIGRFSSKMADESTPDYESLLYFDKLVSRMLDPDPETRITFKQLQEELSKFTMKKKETPRLSTGLLKKFKAFENLDSINESDSDQSERLGSDQSERLGSDQSERLGSDLGERWSSERSFSDRSMRRDSERSEMSDLDLEQGKPLSTLKKTKVFEDLSQFGGNNQVSSDIFKFISDKNLQNLQKLLNREPLQMYEFMEINTDRFTPIEWAVENDCLKCIQVILGTYELFKDDTILRFNSEIRLLGQPMHLAVKKGNRDILHFLITNGFSINKLNRMGFSPLHIAVMQNNLQMVKLLIRYSAVIDIYSRDERSPLKIAIDNKAFDIAKALITAGADIDDDLSIERKEYTDPEIRDFLNKVEFGKVKAKERKKVERIESRDRRYRKELYKRMCENLTAAVPDYVIERVSTELRMDISNLTRDQVCKKMLQNVLFKELKSNY